ncbi:MAG: FeoA domain-containing protein [Clostridia bacterium]|nr:FeoA domain-containing protein [Clostridia bacterium]
MEKLTNVKVGQYRKILALDGRAPIKIKRRLLELGFTAGQMIKVVRKSMFGDTYLIEVRGYYLSMRKSLTGYLIVE